MPPAASWLMTAVIVLMVSESRVSITFTKSGWTAFMSKLAFVKAVSKSVRAWVLVVGVGEVVVESIAGSIVV